MNGSSSDQPAALARDVQARRRSLGLTQASLADLAGVSTRFVHDVEAGKQTVQLDKVLAVLGALGLHLSVQPGRGAPA